MRIFLTNSFRSKDFMGVLTDCMLSLAISILGMFLKVGFKGFTLFGMVIFLSHDARYCQFYTDTKKCLILISTNLSKNVISLVFWPTEILDLLGFGQFACFGQCA